MLHERVRRAFLDIAEEEPDRCVVIDASQPEAMVAEDVWEVVLNRLEPMSVAAERQRTAQAEPDRLEGFSAPREVDRVFGHEARDRRVRRRALLGGRMHHAWLLVGPEGVGKATLAYQLRAHACSPRAMDAAQSDRAASKPCSARSRRCRIPISLRPAARL